MSVASKNPYDLLGNEDGDAEAVKAPAARTAAAKAQPARRGGASGNDAAFRDRGAGADRNRSKPTDDAPRGGPRGGGQGARVRGGRGSRHPRDRDDRHSKGLPGQDKHFSGADGDAEKKDEEAGEAIAKTDEKAAAIEDSAAAEEAELEDKQVSYDDYIAQQAEKKLTLGEAALSVRAPNEGTKANKQWAAAKPLVKEEDDEFIAGSGGKAKRERERKVKQVVEIDQRYVEPDRPRGGGRGGRGGPRGGSDSFRGSRGSGENFRGSRGGPRGGPHGGPRGGARGRGEGRGEGRGAFRGSSTRGGAEGLNPKDESAFPSLGS